MTPLEYAGRAVADEWTRIFPGSRPTEEHRIRLARAALLALADRLETEPDSDACIVKLRSIATERTENNV